MIAKDKLYFTASLIQYDIIKPIKRFIPVKPSIPPRLISKISNGLLENTYEINNTVLTNMIYNFCNSRELSNSDFYFKACLDKANFSNFICSSCKPSRDTLLCILLALELPNENISKYMEPYGYHYPGRSARDKVIFDLHDYSLANKDSIEWNHYVMEINFAIHDINDILEKQAMLEPGKKFTRMKLLPNKKDY